MNTITHLHNETHEEKLNTIFKDMAVGDSKNLNRAIEAGDILNEKKAELGHGKWMPWVKDNLAVTKAQTSRYMKLSQNKARLPNVASTQHLTIDGAITLINKQLKQEAIDRGEIEAPTETQKEAKNKPALAALELDAPATDEEMMELVQSFTNLTEPRYMNNLPENVKEWLGDEHKQIKEMLAAQSKTTRKKSMTAFVRLLRYHDMVFQNALIEKLPAKTKKFIAELEKREAVLKEEEIAVVNRSKRLGQILTKKDAKIILGCLHPDRAPKGKEAIFAKAFNIAKKAM